jgi:hypothetical protein
MILGIPPGESYSSICALADLYLCALKYINKLSSIVAGETVAVILSNQVCPFIFPF